MRQMRLTQERNVQDPRGPSWTPEAYRGCRASKSRSALRTSARPSAPASGPAVPSGGSWRSSSTPAFSRSPSTRTLTPTARWGLL